MKRYLEYKDEKSSKFWEITVVKNVHTVSYGKIKSNGLTKTKEFATDEAAIKDAEKLVKAKLKKGYFISNQEEEDSQEKWFDRLSHKIFTIYKAAILKYPVKEYKYIQLNWTGQGFALGLNTNPRDENHEYIDNGDWHNEDNTSLESVYRELENIPYEEYDSEDDCEYEVEFEREEWPNDADDCYELEYFLINLCLALSYIKLEKDTQVKKYLKTMQVIKIISCDRALGHFTYHHPDEEVRKNIMQALLKNDEERRLALNLWGEDHKNSGADFLKHFQREVTKIKDMPKLTLEKAHKQAYDLNLHFKSSEAIEVLQPVLENALKDSESRNPELLEKCCDVMGLASINVKNGGKESIYWFLKGLKFVPNGHCALSLMSLYSLYLKDDKAMIEFCEEHLQNINIEDNVDHTVECYRYLGKGYLEMMNEEKSTATYKTLVDFVTKMEQTWRIDDAIDDLENISDWQSRYEIATKILTWLKPLGSEED